MERVVIVLHRENVEERFRLSMTPKTARLRNVEVVLALDDLKPVLSTLGVDPAIAERFHQLPSGSTIIWYAEISDGELPCLRERLESRRTA